MLFIKLIWVIYKYERKYLSCNKLVKRIIMGLLKGDKGS